MRNTAPTRSALAMIATAGIGIAALSGCTAGSDSGVTEITLAMQQADVENGDPTTWAIVQNFQDANPDIKITVTGQPVAEHGQAISVAAQSKTLPEIFWLNNADFGRNLAEADALLDLTPMLEAEGLTDKFRPESLAAFNLDGTQFGVPYQGLVTGLYVNSKLLADNGLEVPVTFDDLLDVAETLSDKGIVTISNGANQTPYSVWSFLTMLDRYGFDEKIDAILAGDQSYDNPDFLAFYESVQELQEAGAFASNVATQNYDQAVTEYLNGNAAILDSGVWAASAIQQSDVGADTVFWTGPTFEDGVGEQDIAMNVVGAPLAVSGELEEGTPKYEAVQKFLGYYYSDEGQQVFTDNGQPPVTLYSPTIPEESTVLQSVLDAIAGKPGPRNQPDLYFPAAVQNAMYDSIYGVIQGQLSPQEAVEMVRAAIDAE